MTNRFPRVPFVISLSIILAISGCGRRSEVPLSRAGGRALMDGIPLCGGAVIFTAEQGFSASAPIQSDGTFEFTNSHHGPGVPLGNYRVTFWFPEPLEVRESDPNRETLLAPRLAGLKLPRRYWDASTTDLRATVIDGVNRFEFKIDSKSKKKS